MERAVEAVVWIPIRNVLCGPVRANASQMQFGKGIPMGNCKMDSRSGSGKIRQKFTSTPGTFFLLFNFFK